MGPAKTPQRINESLDSSLALTELTQPSTSARDLLMEELSAATPNTVNPNYRDFIADPAPFIASMGDYPAPPPGLDSLRLEAELQQVREIAARSSPASEASSPWNRAPTQPWNEIAAELAARYDLEADATARLSELLRLAHHDALVLAGRAKEEFTRPAPWEVDQSIPLTGLQERISAYPSEHAAVAAASRDILLEFFPNERARLEQLFFDHLSSRIAAGVSFPSDLSAGAEIGHHVGLEVLAYRNRFQTR